MTKNRLTLLALPLVLMLGGTACSAPAEEPAPDPETVGATAAEFPREVSVDDEVVRVEEEPRRIAVLSGDAANLVADLVELDRIIAVPDTGADTLDVETILPGGADADPEQVLALNPDLVILTARHGSEHDAAAMLEQAGVPSASFGSAAWGGLDPMLATMDTIGELTGTEERAGALRAELEAEREEITGQLDQGAGPRVLTLMARGDQQMMMAPTTMLNGLVREAGGQLVVDEHGLQGSATADPEQIIELAPDVILVEDFRGQGRQDFADLIGNPALAEVPAIRDGAVEYMSRTTTGSSAGTRAVEGLREVATAIGTVE